jgi:hypothetical protein
MGCVTCTPPVCVLQARSLPQLLEEALPVLDQWRAALSTMYVESA